MNTEIIINDFENQELRNQLIELSNSASIKILTDWAIKICKHAYDRCEINYRQITFVMEGFLVAALYIDDKAKKSDIRRVMFQLEKFSRTWSKYDPKGELLGKSAINAIGTPSAVGRSLICSDYAIKAIYELNGNNLTIVNSEREYQIQLLKELLEN
jgi:hypothetical protein